MDGKANIITPAMAQYFRMVLSYDEKSGELRWEKHPSIRHQRFNGKIAGSVNKQGYVVVSLYNYPFRAHRVIWAMINNGISDNEYIDHINGVKSDNRISNLRLATEAENHQNQKLCKRNTSGVKGVIWEASRGMWRCQIMKNRKSYLIGRFKDIESAKKAMEKARASLHGNFANNGEFKDVD